MQIIFSLLCQSSNHEYCFASNTQKGSDSKSICECVCTQIHAYSSYTYTWCLSLNIYTGASICTHIAHYMRQPQIGFINRFDIKETISIYIHIYLYITGPRIRILVLVYHANTCIRSYNCTEILAFANVYLRICIWFEICIIYLYIYLSVVVVFLQVFVNSAYCILDTKYWIVNMKD